MPNFGSIAVSPSGSTLLNAITVTTTGTVLNEVVSVGDPTAGSSVAGVIASTNAPFGLIIEPGGKYTQTVALAVSTVTSIQPTAANLNVTAVIAATSTITAAQATASALNATVIGTVTAAQATAANLNATVVGTVTSNAGTGTLAVSAASLPLAYGAGTIGYGQVVITTAATQIITTRATRKALIISVLNNGPNLFFGDASVATNTGLLVVGIQGASPSVPTTAALYAVAAGTTTSNAVSYMELYS